MYVKDTLSVIRRTDLESKFSGECIILELLLPKSKGILVGTFYHPPSQKNFMDPFRAVLESSCAESKELLITGDFNCDFLAKPCSRVTNELKGIFTNFNLSPLLITKATRTTKDSSTLLNLFATNCPRHITLLKLSNLA